MLQGETHQELISPGERVDFVRLSRSAMGQIKNIVEEDQAGNLYLRFAFDLVLQGVKPGPAAAELRRCVALGH
ncbi:AtaL-like protein [Cupriavidus necator]|uniref:AtaL-like protein n=1 Tax=Cupriavidus necator TaxID=106590 RepID=UPI003F741086